MKKISYLIVMVVAFLILIPGVSAKEINISNLDKDNNPYTVEEGDVLIYDPMDRENDSMLLEQVHILTGGDTRISKKLESSSSTRSKYTVLSYEEAIGEKIPTGKKVSITVNIWPFCVEYMNLFIDYNLIDDVKKNVVYNNTFDAVNNNPESYYEGETDILLEDIKRDGYKFLGWYKTSDYQEDSRVTTITKGENDTLQLYAKWEKIENEVKVDTIDENPNTYASTYVIAGVFIILMLSTVAVYVYGKKYDL